MPFKKLSDEESIATPTKPVVCPPLPVVSTITADQKESGQNTTNTEFDFRCFGSDNYIDEFQIRAGDYIDGLSIKCKTDPDQYFPWAGGQGGIKTIVPSRSGFSKIGIDSNEYIYGMELYDETGSSLSAQGKKSQKQSTLDCGGGILAGIVGKTGTNKYGNFVTQISKGFCIPQKQTYLTS